MWKLELDSNQITAMHKKTFSHLTNMIILELGWNICTSSAFLSREIDFKDVEKEMAECGRRYTLYKPEDFEWTSSGEATEQGIGGGEETSETPKDSIDQKFDAVEGKFENLESRFEDLKKTFDAHDAEIKEIKRLLEKMISQ